MTEIVLGTALLTLVILFLTATVILARRVLMPSRAVTLTVNGTKQIAARAGDRLLSALNDGGILVPSACAGAGTCGLCRVTVTDGGGAALPTEAAILTLAERRQGQRLACQLVLRGDVELDVPEDALGADTFTCTVREARFLTPLIREVVLDLPPGTHPQIVAGSFLQITAPVYSLPLSDLTVPPEHARIWDQFRALSVNNETPVTRAYSISNRPEDNRAGRIVLNIRLALPPPTLVGVPPGIVSTYLFGVSPGDPVLASGPFGSFRAQETGREMVFIGGGVGMAPLRAIILDQLERIGTGRRMSFWYGARNEAELFYFDEMDDLARRYPNFRWTPALSDPRPSGGWQGATGFVHQVVQERFLAGHAAPEDCEYYLCGPPLMIKAVLAMLDDAGVNKAAIFNDDFGS
ncbi:MAG: NADH:ubiquinone reductase (Na(+)-transporting) subunit F [Pseudorhodobacter sp.]